jgi:hypothetical protein
MVNTSQVETLLKQYFDVLGQVTVRPNGVVDVQGDVKLKRNTWIKQLPVQFGHVSGDFHCSDNELTSLQGAPDHVDGNFMCYDNHLPNLVGAPRHVGGRFACSHNKLTSLEGAPDHVGDLFLCLYDAHLPLLRLTMYDSVNILWAPEQVEKIIDKYAGEGKPGAIKAAAELIRAGYKDNAKW